MELTYPQIHIGPNCMGSGNCVYIAPSTFDIDDDSGRAVASEPPQDPLSALKDAERGCPTRSIRIVDRAS